MNCECRRLSPKTTINYKSQIQHLLNFLNDEEDIAELEKVTPKMIRSFMLIKQRSGNKPAYINDLLKAFKCFFQQALLIVTITQNNETIRI